MQSYYEGRTFLNNFVTTVQEVKRDDVHAEFYRPQDHLVSTVILHIATFAFLIQWTEYPIFPRFALLGYRICRELQQF